MDTQVITLPVNHRGYAQAMQQSLNDKLFFLERLPDDVCVFAEFGCADGALLREVVKRKQLDYCVAIGYDHDPAMIMMAQEADLEEDLYDPFIFTDDWRMFSAQIHKAKQAGQRVCLILSSVVHEVLSQKVEGWRQFWAKIKSLGCDFIAVRDMACEAEAFRGHVHPLMCNQIRVSPLTTEVMSRLPIPGFFRHRADMLQTLLKYPYVENVVKECEENYFPLSAEQWLNWTTVGSGYKLRYFDHRSLPYLVDKWRQDLRVTITDPTHVYLLLQRN